MNISTAAWREVRIGDICDLNPREPGPEDQSTAISFIPMPAVSDTEGVVLDHDTRTFSEVAKGYTKFRDGDVIFAKITPCMENGKIAIAKNLHNGFACGSTEFHVLRAHSCILPAYLWLFLRQTSFRNEAERHMTGAVGQRRVPLRFLEEAIIPLPPIDEQRRIVRKLDGLRQRSKGAREELDHIPKLIGRYKQEVLATAFRGALTEEWRDKHSNLRPIDIHTAERAASSRRQKSREAGPNFEPPFDIPPDWVWARLPLLGVLDRGRSRHRPRNHPSLYGGPYPFIQTGEVKAANGFLTSYSQTYSEAGLAQSRLWPKGTLCITIAANIADTAILGVDACFPDSVVGFTADLSLCNPMLIEFFIRTVQADLAAFAPATAQKNINLETLNMVHVPCAPLEEQAEIVRQIELAFKRIDQIAFETERVSQLLDRLDQSILEKAFRGDLIAAGLSHSSDELAAAE
jgi:type I restriction enzyme S subunit